MADLAETETYEAGIYQFEITDPVIGGPDGIDNLQAKQLANRTNWLKANKQDKDSLLTAMAALTIAADKLIYATSADAFSTTTLSAFARSLLDDADAATMRATIGAVSLNDVLNIITPGSVMFFAAITAPSGFIKANGAAISRTTYSALFAAIGTTFGAGNGSTTFNLPDLRGEFIRGWDDARGIDGGRVFGSWQAEDFKSHTHALPYGPNSGGGTYALNNVYNAIPLSGYTGATQTSGGVETRPRNIALLACIKY